MANGQKAQDVIPWLTVIVFCALVAGLTIAAIIHLAR